MKNKMNDFSKGEKRHKSDLNDHNAVQFSAKERVDQNLTQFFLLSRKKNFGFSTQLND
jgi:hypothetical protein